MLTFTIQGTAYCILRNETKRKGTKRNETGYLRVRYAKMWKNHFFAMKRTSGQFLQVKGMRRRITRVFRHYYHSRRQKENILILLAFRNKKSTKEWFDRAALWRVYVYLISSTSMQNENPFWNFVRQIKIRCAKYKFAERSHNFL